MKLSIVTMTPEWAANILQTQNINNRRLRPQVVAHYAEAIRAGQWKLTQQGIAISAEGVLLDGQHRLAAIVAAEQSVEIALATDCDPSIFAVIDTGSARLASDLLQMNGYSNATAVAAGLKSYILYRQYPDILWSGIHRPSHTDILSLSKSRQNDIAFASDLCASAYYEFRKLRKSGIVAFVLLAIDNNIPRETIAEFIASLSSGAGLSDYSPILRLRAALVNDVIRNKRKHAHQETQLFLASLIKAFNYDKDNVQMKLFKLPELPPMPRIEPFSETF